MSALECILLKGKQWMEQTGDVWEEWNGYGSLQW